MAGERGMPGSLSRLPSLSVQKTLSRARTGSTIQERRPAAEGTVDVTVIIPTRNESGNVASLIARLEQALDGMSSEIVFVDDSDDDTVASIEAAQQRSRLDIRYVHRAKGERSGGLGGAVVAGYKVATGRWWCVMDGDLQHPPEVIPQMLQQARARNSDMVIASRYVEQGDAAGLNIVRTVVSQASTIAARLLFPRQLWRVSDPLTGFYMIRSGILDIEDLQPRGFKILLEILVRNPHLRVAEVGFHFGNRYAEESKATLREGVRYFSLLMQLRLDAGWMRFVRFATVGASGIVVNLLLAALFTEWLGFHYLASAVLATQGSTGWNFALTDRWVFRKHSGERGAVAKLAMFLLLSNLAFVVRGPAIYLFTEILEMHYLASTFISLVVFTVLRFGLSDSWIWGKGGSQVSVRTTRNSVHSYDIHGIVSVESQVRLPELEKFRVAERIANPTIRVCLKAERLQLPQNTIKSQSYDFSYHDGLGPIGFDVHVAMSDVIEIQASPLLRHSPHVLYTNVVEPILRWTFVERGYALVHGACIAFGDQAFIVTARTDTGKTTTILRILSRQRRAIDIGSFLSDDLTLLTPSGMVLTYPKPMTISHHTVAAVQTALLTRRERFALRIQSRLHSRDGRQFALLLAKMRLPAATINTITQLIVPPPKYHVQRLVPGAKVASSAYLAGMFVIERDGLGEIMMNHEEAIETLLANSDDAYGFPPYNEIREFLFARTSTDLPAREREIVTSALAAIPAQTVRSQTMDWASRIPNLITTRFGVTLPVREPRIAELSHYAAD